MLQDLQYRLDGTYQAGVVRRSGEVVGAWLADGHDRFGGFALELVWKGVDGRLAALRENVRRGPHPGPVACEIASSPASESARRGPFGAIVRVLDALANTGLRGRAFQIRSNLYKDVAKSAPRLSGDECEAAVQAFAVRLGDAVRPFLDALDPDALALNRTGAACHADEWAGIDGTLTPDAPLRRALVDLPLFQATLRRAWRTSGDPRRHDPATADAVIAREVHAMTGLSKTCVAGLRDAHASFAASTLGRDAGRPSSRGDRRRRDPLVDALGQLASLPPNWIPSCRAEWDACFTALPMIQKARWLFERGGDPMSPETLTGLLRVGGRWGAWLHAVVATVFEGRNDVPDAGEPLVTTLESAMQDVEDFADALTDQVVVPALRLVVGEVDGDAWGRVSSGVLSLLTSGRSLRATLGRSASWHRGHALPALPTAPGSPLSVPWEAWLPSDARGDLRLVVLTTPAELADEGRHGPDLRGVQGLAHCVASYAGGCREGRSRIASVRRVQPDGTWTRVSTVDFQAREWGGPLQVAQHRGHRNGTPPADARAFVGAYLERNASAGGPWRDERVGGVEAAGYDLDVPGNWEAVARSWEPFLPRDLRALAPEDWAALPGRLAEAGYDGSWREQPFGVGPPPPSPERESPRP